MKKPSDPVESPDADHPAEDDSSASTHPTEHRLPALPRPVEDDSQWSSKQR